MAQVAQKFKKSPHPTGPLYRFRGELSGDAGLIRPISDAAKPGEIYPGGGELRVNTDRAINSEW